MTDHIRRCAEIAKLTAERDEALRKVKAWEDECHNRMVNAYGYAGIGDGYYSFYGNPYDSLQKSVTAELAAKEQS